MRFELNDMPLLLSDRDTELLKDAFAGFESSATTDSAAEQRVLSSVMRKAGYGMKETKTGRIRRLNKRFIGIAAAAAVLVCGAIGAAAAVSRMSTEPDPKLKSYWSEKGAAAIMEQSAGPVLTRDCADMELTVDTMFCDGTSVDVLLSYKGLTNRGRQDLRTITPQLYYTDTGEPTEVQCAISGFADNMVYGPDEYGTKWDLLLPEKVIDLSRPIGMRFYVIRYTGEMKDGLPLCEDDFETYKELSFELVTAPNVEHKTLTGGGATLTLSPYGISRCEVESMKEYLAASGASVSDPLLNDVDRSIGFIMEDGTEKNFSEFLGEQTAPGSTLSHLNKLYMLDFGTYADISQVAAVRLGSVVYSAE